MKTLKQIADELEIDKQKVYRYVKKADIPHIRKENTMYFNDVAESLIKSEFTHKDTHQKSTSRSTSKSDNDTVIDALLKQLESKDLLIKELNERLAESHKLIDQQQQLNANAEKKIQALEEKAMMIEDKQNKKKPWWRR